MSRIPALRIRVLADRPPRSGGEFVRYWNTVRKARVGDFARRDAP